MKFYDRAKELAELKRIQKLSFDDHSRLTVLTGRRRIGKTSLVMKASEGQPTVYLFVSRKSEASPEVADESGCQRFNLFADAQNFRE